MKGEVKFYNAEKRYGFIKGDDGTDYFVHESDLNGGTIRDGDTVEFEPGQGDRGARAKNVKPAGDADTSEPESDADSSDEELDEAA